MELSPVRSTNDGRASIEHQLSIHVNDLVDAYLPVQSDHDHETETSPPKSNEQLSREERIGLMDVLMGIKYCMDYRIKGGKMRNLDFDMMKKLCGGLLLHMKHREMRLIWPRTTEEADLSFTLFGEFLQEVKEFRKAVVEVPAPDLAYSLKIHNRIRYVEQRESCLALLSLLTSYFPNQFTVSELVKSSYLDEVTPLLLEYQNSNKSDGVKMPTDGLLLNPPPSLYADRRVERILDMYNTSLDKGLQSETVGQIVDYYGLNVLPPPPKPSVLRMLWVQITDFMVLILITATILSAVLSHYDSAVVLAIVIVLNIVIGFSQEYKASRALEALLSLNVPQAKVIRDGEQSTLDSRELVPGDIVVLEEGDAVPADLRLVEVSQLEVVESVLTGESVAVAKSSDPIRARTGKLPLGDCHGNAFMSTVVSRGRAKGVVVRTGAKTEIGKISTAILSTQDVQTPMQIRLARLGIILVVLSVALCGLVVIIGAARQRDIVEIVTLGVTLAVSVIPEGLVAVVTVTMAIGVRRMASRKAVIRKLHGVETLGSVTVICSDKTGTLTEGKMTAKEIWAGPDMDISFTGSSGPDNGDEAINKATGKALCESPKDAPVSHCLSMMVCALCNNSSMKRVDETWESTGDPTELALLVASMKSKMDKSFWENDQKMSKLGEFAFDSERKLMSVIYEVEEGSESGAIAPGKPIICVKGAPEEVLSRCVTRVDTSRSDKLGNISHTSTKKIDDSFNTSVSKQSAKMASSGLRVLGLAVRQLTSHKQAESIIEKNDSTQSEQDLTFVGLIGLIDPPRGGVKESVSLCKKAGINVIMITGDHVVTAMAIATDLGIFNPHNEYESRAMKGVEVDILTDEGLRQLNPFPRVFARVSPDNKLRIVKALQDRGDSVAMTGDGVNDAAAIKAANVGVAMGIGGTEITKQAADVVLANDNFTTIVSAVEEGRRVFDNIQKFVLYLLSCNFAEIFVMLIAVAVGVDPPFTAMMILYANIIADVPPSMSLGLEPPEIDVMERSPRDPKHGVITRVAVWVILTQSLIMGSISLAAYFWQLAVDGYPLDRPGTVPNSHAQSLTFMLLTTMQLFQSFLSRSVESSVFRTGFFGNLYMVAAFIFSFIFMIMALFIPGFAALLNLVPLNEWQDWVKILGAVLIQLGLSELLKFYFRWKSRQNEKVLPIWESTSTND